MSKLAKLSVLMISAIGALLASPENGVDVPARISSHQIASYKISDDTESASPKLYFKLWALWTENVLSYYDLDENFGTPLQKQAFEESPDFAALSEDLRGQKANLASTEFFMTLGQVGEYNLKNKSFPITVNFAKNPCDDNSTCSGRMCNPQGKCMETGCGDPVREKSYPNARYGFLLPQIAGKGNKKTEVSWNIKVPAAEAIAIEKAQAHIRIAFVVTGVENKKINKNENTKKKLPNGYSIIVKGTHRYELDFFKTQIKRIDFLDSDNNVIHTIAW